MEEIRVLLVDDNAELRRTLQEQLNKQEGLHVIGECANGLEAFGGDQQKSHPGTAVQIDHNKNPPSKTCFFIERETSPLEPASL